MTQCHIKDVPYDKHGCFSKLQESTKGCLMSHERALVGSKKMQQNVNNDDFLI